MASRRSNDPTASDFGYVYVMSDGPRSRANQYKFGYSGNVQERRKELSGQTAASEELYIVMRWLCPDARDAKEIEKRVKAKLNQDGHGIRKEREFFRCENVQKIKLYVEEAAKQLKCPIYFDVEATATFVAPTLRSLHVIPHDVVTCWPREERAAYFQGALDALSLVALMGSVPDGIESISVFSLGQIANMLEENRDSEQADKTPSLTSTVLGHFRNGAISKERSAAETAIRRIRETEREELFHYLDK